MSQKRGSLGLGSAHVFINAQTWSRNGLGFNLHLSLHRVALPDAGVFVQQENAMASSR